MVIIKERGRKMRYVLVTCLVVLLLALTGCGSESVNGDTVLGSKEQISVRLPIPIIESAFTPFFAAVDQRYYAEEDLEVTFNLGSPETNPVKMVSSGADQFGILGGPDTLLVARSKGRPLVAIGIIHRNSDFPIILTLKDSGLTKLKDLQNRKIGFFMVISQLMYCIIC